MTAVRPSTRTAPRVLMMAGQKGNTMKEYKIQMCFEGRYDGNWVSALQPFGGYAGNPYDDFEQAKLAMYRLAYAWGKNSFGHEPPVDFRIISRNVTPWEPV